VAASPSYASADSILNSDDLKYDEVEVPDWGLVRVRGLTGRERELYDQAIATYKPKGKKVDIQVHAHKMRCTLVGLTVVDGNGDRIFKTPEAREKLGKKSAKHIEAVYDCSARLSGLLAEDEDDDGPEDEASP